MIEIDGSMGEGGGQLLRYSVALSVLLGKDVRIYNIRAKRSNPGLRPQHLAAVRTIASLADAEVEGLSVGSMEVVVRPRRRPSGGPINVDIGTAGSISLLLQAVLPVLLFAEERAELKVIGGTTVRWAPPMPYMQHVLARLLELFGARVRLEVLRRGYYPRGGGVVRARVEPVERLEPVELDEFREIEEIGGLSYVSNLPTHIAHRQASAARRRLEEAGYGRALREIEVDYKTPAVGRGTGIVLWALTDQAVLGGDSIGEVGKPAERVGREAADKLVEELRARAAVDEHALDNLVIYTALAKGRSRIYARRMTSHAETAIALCSTIAGARYRVYERGAGVVVEAEGIGLER